ncbi:hypothetical protein SAMN04490220_7103 [Rhodococcus jostii]|uniref:Uncharacterized protein n=1 Tax=Rhodococcus jostii TaxID=132919 RepID=A0A1H5H9U8_RHOJO|nr:hypothetical protein SAMN04490220_7103 [Rhodococcus jostii]
MGTANAQCTVASDQHVGLIFSGRIALDLGDQSNSRIVALAIPPASHIDCNPYRISLSRM